MEFMGKVLFIGFVIFILYNSMVITGYALWKAIMETEKKHDRK